MRAQRRYEQTVRAAMVNVPCSFGQTADYFKPRVKLDSLPAATREHLLQESRREAESWLEAEAQRAKAAEQQAAVQAKLQDWYEQKEAVRQSEQERKALMEAEKDRAERAEKQRWKKRGESLQRRVADWAADKAEKEEKEERAAAQATQAIKERERRRYQCYLESQKRRLEEWYQEKGCRRASSSPPATAKKETPCGQAQHA